MVIRWRTTAIACVVFLAACGTPDETSTIGAAGADATGSAAAAGSEQDRTAAEIALAQAKYTQSQTAGFAWRAARIALDEAQAAYADADYALASSKAQMASQLAADSLEQARAEATAWKTRLPFGQ